MEALANVQAFTAVAIRLIVGLSALGAALGLGVMRSKFLESTARQPKLVPILQRRMFLHAGLLDHVGSVQQRLRPVSYTHLRPTMMPMATAVKAWTLASASMVDLRFLTSSEKWNGTERVERGSVVLVRHREVHDGQHHEDCLLYTSRCV